MMKIGCCGFPIKREIYNNDPLPEGDFVYVRLHGKTGYRYNDSEDDLKELLKRVEPYREAYLMFNNMNMYENAQHLKILSKGEKNHPRERRCSNPFKGERRWK